MTVGEKLIELNRQLQAPYFTTDSSVLVSTLPKTLILVKEFMQSQLDKKHKDMDVALQNCLDECDCWLEDNKKFIDDLKGKDEFEQNRHLLWIKQRVFEKLRIVFSTASNYGINVVNKEI